jgi:hypothetical protein
MRYTKFITVVSILMALLSFCCSNTARAVDVTVKGLPLHGKDSTLKATATLAVEDNVLTSSTGWNVRNVKNLITFKIDEFSAFTLPDSFKVSVVYQVDYKVWPSAVIQTRTDSLVLTYNKTNPYTNRVVTVIPGVYNSVITITSVNSRYGSVPLSAFAKSIMLESEIQSSRDFIAFDCNTHAVQSISKNLGYITSNGELEVNWGSVLQADEYDLEWAVIDEAALPQYYIPSTTTPDPLKIFDDNATRVSLGADKVNYRIPLLYEKGTILFVRVRSVQVLGGNQRREANWSSAYAGGMERYDITGGLAPTMDWQATTSFAEEGKRKSVVQFYDGTLRSRQTVTKDNVRNTTVVAETFYDLQGRPQIQVLPAPTISNIIRYTPNFNVNVSGSEYTKDSYDKLLADYCGTGADKLGTASGAGRYYSTSNTEDLDGNGKFIPDAQGYPFTETKYTQDATGRISEQGGVGAYHQLGQGVSGDATSKGHLTKYYYTTADQEDLDALFGTEAGDASHYSKNMVKDANGQLSVSYVDMHGRTIATALAGTPANSNLENLNSNVSALQTRNLLGAGSNLQTDKYTIQSVKSLSITKAGLHTFNYTLGGDSIRIKDCADENICYECKYDLEITITDDCNNQNMPGGVAYKYMKSNFNLTEFLLHPDTSCTAPTGIIWEETISLPEGAYMVTKKLSVNKQALETYRDKVFLDHNTCKTLDQFIDSVKTAILGNISCETTCQQCTDSLGTWESYREKFMLKLHISVADSASYRQAALNSYEIEKTTCNEICGTTGIEDETLALMLEDVSAPAGQYANDAGVNLSGRYPWSIFSADFSAAPKLKYQSPASPYLDSDGQPSLVNGVVPELLTPAEFEANFKDSWAKSLLPKHPEYARLLRLQKFKNSNAWDKDFENTTTYAAAYAKGYLNPTGKATAPFINFAPVVPASIDPFYKICLDSFSIANKVLAMETYMQDVTQGTVAGGMSIWNLSTILVKCDDDDPVCNAHYSLLANAFHSSLCTADLDAAWAIFRDQYLAYKASLLYEVVTLNTPVYPAVPLNNTDVDHMLRILTPQDNTATIALGNGASTPGGYIDNNNALLAAEIEDGCNGYVNTWMAELSTCNYTPVQWDTLKRRLIAVCVAGGDASHPSGSSTVAPGSTYTPPSFAEVIRLFNIEAGVTTNAACNADLISQPLSYDAQLIAQGGDEIISEAPDQCLCDKVRSLKQSYTNYPNGAATFSAYVYQQLQVTMSDSDLTRLQNLCNDAAAGTCSTPDPSLVIPLGLQCVPSSCLTCTEVSQYYTQFRQKYGEVINLADSISDAQIAINKLFENYMNHITGMNKTVREYAAFMKTCGINFSGTLPGSLPTCTQLQDTYTAYSNSLTATTHDGDGTETGIWILSQSNIPRDVSGYKLKDFVRDGMFSTPDSVTLYPGDFGVNYGKNVCVDGGEFSAELRVRTKAGFDPMSAQLLFTFQFDGIALCQGIFTANNSSACGIIGITPPDAPYYDLVHPELIYPMQNWNNIRFTFKNHRVYIYLNGILKYSRPYNFNITYISLFTMGGRADTPMEYDYIRLYDRTDRLVFNEEFNDVANFAKPPYKWICGRPSCSTVIPAFTTYFNTALGTSYSYNEIAALYKTVCNTTLDLCAPAPENQLCKTPASLPAYNPPSKCDLAVNGATDLGTQLYQLYRDSLANAFEEQYLKKCTNVFNRETFTVTDSTSEYHYTLYYYDQAGNLVKTIPPEGVNLSKMATKTAWSETIRVARLAGTHMPVDHALPTRYRYNTLNQVVSQVTPDAGSSGFWYDRLGRLVVSQNAKQKSINPSGEENRRYSYTLYDQIGRINEVGEYINTSSTPMSQALSRNASMLGSWLGTPYLKREVVTTTYDVPNPSWYGISTTDIPLSAANLRNRVAFTQYYPAGSPAGYNYQQATYYSYDIHGNVDTLIQDFGSASLGSPFVNMMNNNGIHNRFKKIVYQYDLISGKVNHVAYQPQYIKSGYLYRPADAMYHKYEYDAENRITAVFTSTDSLIWEKDAAYDYYKHGPLARTILGDQQVQGLDYAYTIQGWLKGVNSSSLSPDKDMGLDGLTTNASTRYIARDALGFSLNYFNGDYQSISAGAGTNSMPLHTAASGITNGLSSAAYRPLYNGNISSMVVNIGALSIPDVTGSGTTNGAILYNYKYDQLNRLKAMDAYKGLTAANNSWANIIALRNYRERISYDGNGNILTYSRYGNNNSQQLMDSLDYSYNYLSSGTLAGKLSNNRLRRVRDYMSNAAAYDESDPTTGVSDLEDQTNADNYTYDAIGNLKSDAKENISLINWNVYGKITDINFGFVANKNKTIYYLYDASGNRIGKQVEKYGATSEATTSSTYTWYTRDASGNVMATYSSSAAGSAFPATLSLGERHLYGSSRLGILAQQADSKTLPYTAVGTIYGSNFIRGNKFFELSNHLGNVLVTISDKKIGVNDGTYDVGGVKLNSTPDDKIDYYTADVVTANDYYPFGMLMPGRKFDVGTSYRYGFNGQEKSNEIKGEGNSYTAEYWEYDPRIGRRWNIDPVVKTYESSYATFSNNPIWHIDSKGNSDTIPPSLASKNYAVSLSTFMAMKVDPLVVGFEHSHKDHIDATFRLSGGSGTFKLNEPTINIMNANLRSVVPGTILLPPSGEAITNLKNAYYSKSESGSEKAWINLLLGGMMKGTVPENIVFSQNGTVSSYMIGSPAYNGILDNWDQQGRPNEIRQAEYSYGLGAQVNDFAENNLSFLSISNFNGSVSYSLLANPTDNIISLTITNVSSVNSGDLQKHNILWHSETAPFLLRDPNKTSPQPYTNFSQTYQIKIKYTEALENIKMRKTQSP